MAIETKKELRQSVIYSIYVRSHTKEGTFRAVIKDLDRIQALGTDIIWFMPIHPVGDIGRKGSVGSPYAIRHFREINPEYGTMEDFILLAEAIHHRGMKVMIDVVYNHTSMDAWLTIQHPEFYYRDRNGIFGRKIADWEDVYDLNFQNKDLWEYHIESLTMWAEIVDGFRCDVAPLIPLAFWQRARTAVAAVNPECIWLAETVEPEFIKYNRAKGLTALSDGEIFQAFDIAYDYDVINSWRDYLEGKDSLVSYIRLLNFQDVLYPENYIKLRFLENHDRPRVASYMKGIDKKTHKKILNWTAFLYFQKGCTLIYAGQEMQEVLKPSLFEVEKIEWDINKDISFYLQKLYRIKKNIMMDGDYTLDVDQMSDTIIGYYEDKQHYITGRKIIVGIFPVSGAKAKIKLKNVPDGSYHNLIDENGITVVDGVVSVDGEAVIFQVGNQ